MKEDYPMVTIRSLKNYMVTLNEYGPHTVLDKHIRLNLHIYNFTLDSLEEQNSHSIIGKPKEIVGGQEMKCGINFEITKHIRSSLLNKISPDNTLPLEPVIIHNKLLKSLGTIITYEGKKTPKDNAGKIIYSSEVLERMEDSLIEAANKRLARLKNWKMRQKELARRVARQQREKPTSLTKDLVLWAKEYKIKKEEMHTDTIAIHHIKEDVAKVIARGKANLNNEKTKGDKLVNSSYGTIEKSNISEVKFDARGFKNFLSWRYDHDGESNSVKELLVESSEVIQLGFVASTKPPKKAFDGWHTSLPPGKRESSDGANSSKKSLSKRIKL
jgi:hypothetical protein